MSLGTWLAENKVKVIGGAFGAVALIAIVLIVVFGVLKGHPNNHNEAVYGRVRVSIDAALTDPSDRWSSDNLATVRRALTEAQRLGPTIVVSEGESDVTIYKATLNCTTDGVGRFFPNTRIIEIDPRCTQSSLELQAVVIHELGHFMGMDHICTRTGERVQGGCSPVGYGDAVMNFGVRHEDPFDDGPGLDHAWTGPLPVWEITELDLNEFKRAWARRHP